MDRKRCPTCQFHYDPRDRNSYRECTECGVRLCPTCAGKNAWKCPICKSPFGRLEQPK